MLMSHWQVKWDTVLTIKHFEEPIDQAEKVTIKVAVADIVHNSNFARVNGVLCLLLLCSRIVDSTSLLLFFYSTWLKLQRLPNSIKWDKVDQKISKFWISERWRLWNQTSIGTDFPDLYNQFYWIFIDKLLIVLEVRKAWPDFIYVSALKRINGEAKRRTRTERDEKER